MLQGTGIKNLIENQVYRLDIMANMTPRADTYNCVYITLKQIDRCELSNVP